MIRALSRDHRAAHSFSWTSALARPLIACLFTRVAFIGCLFASGCSLFASGPADSGEADAVMIAGAGASSGPPFAAIGIRASDGQRSGPPVSLPGAEVSFTRQQLVEGRLYFWTRAGLGVESVGAIDRALAVVDGPIMLAQCDWSVLGHPLGTTTEHGQVVTDDGRAVFGTYDPVIGLSLASVKLASATGGPLIRLDAAQLLDLAYSRRESTAPPRFLALIADTSSRIAARGGSAAGDSTWILELDSAFAPIRRVSLPNVVGGLPSVGEIAVAPAGAAIYALVNTTLYRLDRGSGAVTAAVGLDNVGVIRVSPLDQSVLVTDRRRVVSGVPGSRLIRFSADLSGRMDIPITVDGADPSATNDLAFDRTGSRAYVVTGAPDVGVASGAMVGRLLTFDAATWSLKGNLVVSPKRVGAVRTFP